MTRLEAITGALLGCAVGDALGLPYEGLSKRRGVLLLGPPDRHRFLLGRGMVSDDTEHSRMVLQALCAAPGDCDLFLRHLARHFRWWLAGLPAGIGFATLRAIVNLCLGFSPTHSGVFSAGNGPAMRSAVLGAALDDLDVLRSFVRASTRITHTDPKAEEGAFAVALAAWCSRRGQCEPAAYIEQWNRSSGSVSDEFRALMDQVAASVAARESTESHANRLRLAQGVSGYVFHTVPMVLHAWLSHPRDYQTAVETVIRLGGDTDTTAAIVGGIVGAGVGRAGLPAEWLGGLLEWPYSVEWMARLSAAVNEAVEAGTGQAVPGVPWWSGWGRNGVFLASVLGHVGRRVLPPY